MEADVNIGTLPISECEDLVRHILFRYRNKRCRCRMSDIAYRRHEDRCRCPPVVKMSCLNLRVNFLTRIDFAFDRLWFRYNWINALRKESKTSPKRVSYSQSLVTESSLAS
jgi:hypothetical protein